MISSGAVVQDLLIAIQDEDLNDCTLIGSDGMEVEACRFVLAARSKVLKRMLYGSFREAKSTSVKFMYPGRILQAVVHFCTHNCISDTFLSSKEDADAARQLVKLTEAADYLAIHGLVRDAEALVRSIVSKNPPLACPVFDEAVDTSFLHGFAFKMIRCRPYVALLPPKGDGSGGGIECLRSDRIVELMQDTEIEAGEMFMFEVLKRWVEHAGEGEKEEAVKIAKQCGDYFRLHYIEPQELLSTVQKSGIFSPNLIVEAMMRQALRASEDRVWSINSRGPPSEMDRILVERCGDQQVNGVYHRIKGLNNGDVYSKREVSCGQMMVYTLSCSQKADVIECRIFCSKVLTHRAVQTLQASHVGMPAFQPLLQIIKLERPNRNGTSPFAKLFKVQVSDGDNIMSGTLSEELNSLVEEEQIVTNSLIKILAYEQYQLNGNLCIHVTDVSFVGAQPGHTLGNPTEICLPVVVTSVGTTEVQEGKHVPKSEPDDGLQKLYSCYYPMDQQAKDTKIPRTGWILEEYGVDPAPVCTWIPATGKMFGDGSSCQSPTGSPAKK